MSTPDFKTEAGLAGKYPSRRFGQRERKLLASIQGAFPFGAAFAGTFATVAGSANQSIPVPGCLASDVAIVILQTQGAGAKVVISADSQADAIAVKMSGDPSTDHVLSYVVFRAQ